MVLVFHRGRRFSETCGARSTFSRRSSRIMPASPQLVAQHQQSYDFVEGDQANRVDTSRIAYRQPYCRIACGGEQVLVQLTGDDQHLPGHVFWNFRNASSNWFSALLQELLDNDQTI